MARNVIQLVIAVDGQTATQIVSNFNASLAKIAETASGVTGRTNKSFNSIQNHGLTVANTIRQAYRNLLGYLSTYALADLAASAIKVAADFQQARIGLEALTGSLETGRRLFKEVQAFALESPLTFKGLLEASQKLAATGFGANEIVPALKSISTAVAALGGGTERLNDLIRAFGDIRAAGRLTGEELRQLKNAAIPAIDILAEYFNKTKAETTKLVRSGALDAEAVIDGLLAGLDKRFGQFGERLKETANVALSNLLDALQKFADRALSSTLLPQIVRFVNDLGDQLEDISEYLEDNQAKIISFFSAIATALKGLTLLIAGNLLAKGIISLADKLGTLTKALALARGATLAFNAALRTNLIILGATAFIGTVAAIVSKLDEMSDAQNRVNKRTEAATKIRELYARALAGDRDAANELREAVDRLDRITEKTGIRQYTLTANELSIATNKFGESLVPIPYKLGKIASAGINAGQLTGREILRLVKDGVPALTILSNHFKATADEITAYAERSGSSVSQLLNRTISSALAETNNATTRIIQLDRLVREWRGEAPSREEAGLSEEEIKSIVERSQGILDRAVKKSREGFAELTEEYRVNIREAKGVQAAIDNITKAFKLQRETLSREQVDKSIRERVKETERLTRENLELISKAEQERTDIEKQASNERIKLQEEFSERTTEIYKSHRLQLEELDLSALDQQRDIALQQVEATTAISLDQKLAIEQQKLAIEIQYQEQSTARKIKAIQDAADYEISEARTTLGRIYTVEAELIQAFEARKAAINEQARLRIEQLARDSNAQTTLAQLQTANRSIDLVDQNTKKIFNQIKNSAERTFDQIVSKSESFADAIANTIKSAFLTVFKEIVTSQVARLLTQLLTGSGINLQTTGTVTQGGGGLSNLGRILGALGVGGTFAVGQQGGLRIPGLSGAPGGTPGFAGPITGLGGVGGAGGLGSLGGLGSNLGALTGVLGSLKIAGAAGSTAATPGIIGQAAGLGGFAGPLSVASKGGILGILSALGNLGGKADLIGPETIGITGKGIYGLGGGAALLGGAGLVASGLYRGGLLGALQTTAGGALIGAKFGGPIGAIIGAAIGGGAALIRSLFSAATTKAREKIKQIYNVDVKENGILRQIVATAKQSFGGSIDTAIRSKDVRDLIELYALSTGQDPSSAANLKPFTTSLSQVSGVITQSTPPSNVYSIPQVNFGPPVAQSPQTVINFTMPPEAVNDAFNGRTQQFILNQPGTTLQSMQTGFSYNMMRRETLGKVLEPNTVIS